MIKNHRYIKHLLKYKYLYIILTCILIITSSIIARKAYIIGKKNYNGYCFKEKRYLSEQEKIDRMLKYILSLAPPDIIPVYIIAAKSYPLVRKPTDDDPLIQKPVEYTSSKSDEFYRVDYYENDYLKYKGYESPRKHGYIEYKDIADFKRLNPNCCKFSHFSGGEKGEGWINPEAKIGGIYNFLHINTLIRYYENKDTLRAFNYKYIFEVTNCGEIQEKQNIVTFPDNNDPYISIFSFYDFLMQDK